MSFNDNDSHTSNPQKVPDFKSVVARIVFPVSEESACSGMTAEGFWRRYDIVAFVM